MFKKRQFIDFILVLSLASFVFLFRISANDAGLWEPWETSTMLAARQMSQSSIIESSFWTPQLNGELIAQPYLQLWSLAIVLHAFPDPDVFLLRFPSACIGIFLTLLFFITVRQASTRRAAWVSTLILLTTPMFVFGGKLLHGDIWLVAAVSIPLLFFVLTCYASTRRMQRVMASFTALSLFLSFLCGGLFGLLILILIVLTLFLLVRKHPHRKALFKPFKTRFFLFPLYISFILSATIFGTYVTHARYALEHRMPITLSELNQALDEDRIISIEYRQKQIIGTLHHNGDHKNNNQPFILVESPENLSTNATMIFNLNETEKRTFENYLMWRFQKRTPSKAQQSVPPMDGAIQAALHFFWYHTCNHQPTQQLQLATIDEKTFIRSEEEINQTNTPLYSNQASSASQVLNAGDLVKITDSTLPKWTEIETGSGVRGYVSSTALTAVKTNTQIPWKWWFDTLVYGLMPWIAFFPIAIICALIGVYKVTVAPSVFRGEFVFHSNEDVSRLRSPFQSLLIGWCLIALLALIPSMTPSNHDIFVGIIPMSALLGIAITSPLFWQTIRQSIEARLLWIILSVACFTAALYGVDGIPFRPIKYMLTDPMMHWHNLGTQLDGRYIVFFIFAIAAILISFTGLSEFIQNKYQSWRDQSKQSSPDNISPTPSTSSSTSSSTSLSRVTRSEIEPMPVAPVFSLTILGLISASFLYYDYFPTVSDDFTETALIERYFELADQSEPIYLLSGENEQLCRSYKDCDPGYVCQNSRCHISTFASYSLNVASHISKDNMLQMISDKTNTTPAFYIIPKDALFSINQAYRNTQTKDRHNLIVLDAPSSRLYLIGNHKDIQSINPFDQIVISELPQNVTTKSIKLNENVEIIGFRIDKIDFINAKELQMTLYYRLSTPITTPQNFQFTLEIKGRKREFVRSMIDIYDERQLLPGDLIADKVQFEDKMMPSHGLLDIQIGIQADDPANTVMNNLTTIDFR